MPCRPGVVLLVLVKYSTLLLLLLVCYCYAGSDEQNKPNLRIFNGDDAAEGEYPFVGLLLASATFSSDGSGGGQNMCGGSILSDRIILTAAHCVVKDTAITDQDGSAIDELYYPVNLVFHVGETHLYETEQSEQILNVAGIMVHEEYDSYSVVNDVALLVLDKPITLNDKVATIALPDPADRATLYADGAAITVIGWGTTEDGTTSEKLKKLPYTISSKSDCKTNYGEGLLDGMMCTGTAPTERRADTGDSGGPLFTKKDGKWVQLGLVSWGPTEITATSYDVNTDVLYFRDWIVTHKDSAFTDYVTSLTATNSAKTLILENLANYLYKTIKITPATSTKHTKITIKSGTMKPYDFLIVYDGDDPLHNTMLAQLSGTLSEQSFTSSTVQGLTLAILTGKEGKSDGLIVEYSEVSDAGLTLSSPVQLGTLRVLISFTVSTTSSSATPIKRETVKIVVTK
ncbi:trypsin-1-like isoform X2 [Bolinopsis microptera]|uniref:trypsin-1-like isoform X2 n=1 Tax=Bolinopsis microptera TaxID=2820187 RepID=UPI00307A8E90